MNDAAPSTTSLPLEHQLELARLDLREARQNRDRRAINEAMDEIRRIKDRIASRDDRRPVNESRAREIVIEELRRLKLV